MCRSLIRFGRYRFSVGTLLLLAGIAVGAAIAQPSYSSSSQATAASGPEAPSVAWLIVMPAIPIVGGIIIGVSRKLSGEKVIEGRPLEPLPRPLAEDMPNSDYSYSADDSPKDTTDPQI
ncbi:hypothetical protein PN498_06215 [Oscillatoria sp. CS-180]|uniref:hypothetical protein n=1 Tax=Oscillatoria sp. CS-180 TaxID=3021720 RepID=UPI00232D7E11|nr:hypothetical protein [Oscillatoria sp. CS-180]MDB9525575.1 hypothetical protein [Oscillatoria sp. CS-180]